VQLKAISTSVSAAVKKKQAGCRPPVFLSLPHELLGVYACLTA
jgi:hypothetical protein